MVIIKIMFIMLGPQDLLVHLFIFGANKYAHAMTWAMIDYYYRLYGISYNAKQARIFGVPNTNKLIKIKEKCKDFIMNRHRFRSEYERV